MKIMMLPAILLVACLMTCVALAAADQPLFQASARVSFDADIGQNLGTLFEVQDGAGHTVIAAGFPGIYNTCTRLDRHALQFYIRPRQETQPVKELLPPSSTHVHQSVQDCDGQLYAWTYGYDKTVHRWDVRDGKWVADPILDKDRANFGDGFMRVAGKLLVYQMSQAWYDGKLILRKPETGTYANFYYALGHLFFYHTEGSRETGSTQLYACHWQPGDGPIDVTKALTHHVKFYGETPFVWGQLKGEVLTVSNLGGVYVFDGTNWRMVREPDKGVSYQVYSAVNYGEDLLLGQYPSGHLVRWDGHAITELPAPPVMPGVAGYSREAQSIMLYRGDLYVGVWPWAELWRYDPDTRIWTLASRMFKDPPVTDQVGHPYEAEINAYNEANGTSLVYNNWGQRICGLAPWHDSLMIATSAKGPMERNPSLSFLTDEVFAQYGRIWRYTLPGALAAPVQWTAEPTEIRCTLLRDRLLIEQDGKVIGETRFDPKLLADLVPAKITWAHGLFGRFSGHLRVKQTTPRLPVAYR